MIHQKASCLLRPLLHCFPLSSTFPGGLPALSGVCPWGCYGYVTAVRRQRPARVVSVGGCRPSSCPPPSLGRGPAPCLRRVLVRPILQLEPRLPPSPGSSASLSSPLPVSCLPPRAFARALFVALCVLKAVVWPGGHKAVWVLMTMSTEHEDKTMWTRVGPTCSSVRGSQYIHGAALVLRNKSSNSLAGGSSPFSAGRRNENYPDIQPWRKHQMICYRTRLSEVPYPSYQSSSPCSLPVLSSSSLCLWTSIAARPHPAARTPGPCPGPIPARLAPFPGAPSPSFAPPTDRGRLCPALGLVRALCPCPSRGLCLAQASEGAAGSEEQLAGRPDPPPYLASGHLCESPAVRRKRMERQICWE